MHMYNPACKGFLGGWNFCAEGAKNRCLCQRNVYEQLPINYISVPFLRRPFGLRLIVHASKDISIVVSSWGKIDTYD